MEEDSTVFSFADFSRAAKLEICDLESLAPILASDENIRTWEMVSTSHKDFSIFPPNLHEGIYIQQQIKAAAIAPCLPDGHKEEEEDSGAVVISKSFSVSALRMIVSWFEVLRSRVSGRGGGSAEGVGVGVGVCSMAALAGLAVFLVCLRRRYRREKEFLLFLVEEKNQKIGLLLHQIAELNAVLAAHRKVPVLKRT